MQLCSSLGPMAGSRFAALERVQIIIILAEGLKVEGF